MAILQSFKQKVLELGRGEAKAKARPLTVGGESLDRSAAGMDARVSERAVMFWLLSDRALFLVVGSEPHDHAFRIPYESVREVVLSYDETAEFLPWYLKVSLDPVPSGQVTRLEDKAVPGQPLAPPTPVAVEGDELARLVRGETIPLAGYAAIPKRFRDALVRRMELAGRSVSISGAEAAHRHMRAKKAKAEKVKKPKKTKASKKSRREK